MLRPVLTLLLLLHYLLVVCAGAAGRVELPEVQPFAYVHSHDCQLQNAWRGGHCFEDCNGAQYRQGRKPLTMPQLLASLKSVDLHCLPAAVGPVVAAPPRYRAALPLPHSAGSAPEGVRGNPYQPPCRG